MGKIFMLKKHFNGIKIFWIAFTILILLLLLFEILPIYSVIKLSFVDESGKLSLINYATVLSNDFILQSIYKSIEISFISSIIGLAISVIFCNSLRYTNSRIRDWVLSFYNLSSNFAGVPLAFAFIIILGFNGAITILLSKLGIIESFNLYSKTGIIILYIYFQIPLGVLMLYPAYQHLDPNWKNACYLLGGNKLTYWTKIGLPALKNSILSTFVLLFANALGAYATAFALMSGNYNLIPIRIAGYISSDVFYNPGLASALSVVMVCILIVVAIINFKIINRRKV